MTAFHGVTVNNARDQSGVAEAAECCIRRLEAAIGSVCMPRAVWQVGEE